MCITNYLQNTCARDIVFDTSATRTGGATETSLRSSGATSATTNNIVSNNDTK